MTSNIGQRGRTARTTLSIAIAAGVLALVAAPALATPVTLVGIVLSPDGPIGPSDSIRLGAVSLEELFPHSVSVTSTLTVLEESFAIRWHIVSQPPVGVRLPALVGVAAMEEIGPLAPGTYDVTIEWQHVGDPGVLLDPAKDHGTGAFRFTVVPEPTSAALLAAGMAVLLAGARRAAGDSARRAEGTQADFS